MTDGRSFQRVVWTALARWAGERILDKTETASLHCAIAFVTHPGSSGHHERAAHLSMRNLNFGFFDDCGLPRESRILIFYSFETEERLPRSGIMHYHLGEGRFVGPRHDRELTTAALQFLSQAGRIPNQTV